VALAVVWIGVAVLVGVEFNRRVTARQELKA
jgi:hypothetical protein